MHNTTQNNKCCVNMLDKTKTYMRMPSFSKGGCGSYQPFWEDGQKQSVISGKEETFNLSG
jgi:hypothetical protein